MDGRTYGRTGIFRLYTIRSTFGSRPNYYNNIFSHTQPLLMKRLSDGDCFCDVDGDNKAGSGAAEFTVAESSLEVTVFSCGTDVFGATQLLGGVSVADVCCWLL